MDYNVSSCVILVTGDIAFSGSEEEYLIAFGFLDSIKSALASQLKSPSASMPVTVNIVCVPGNHDCDFSGDQSIRDIVVEKILSERPSAPDFAYVAHVTSVQPHFFNFLSAVESIPRAPVLPGVDVNLGWQYSIETPNSGRKIKILCVNTAWLSKKRERQGSLYYPESLIPQIERDSDLLLCLYHHPYNWLEPANAREFRGRVEKVADLILTGHEHVSSRTSKEGEGDSYVTQIEGGVLQESSDPNRSEFNVFVLDTHNLKHKHFRCTWNGTHYSTDPVLVQASEGGWEELPLNRARRTLRFTPSDAVLAFLADPGIQLHHSRVHEVTLDKIFVCPDLREIDLRKDVLRQSTKIVRGDVALEHLDKHQYVMITGDTQSGKSALAKTLFGHHLARGRLPVLVGGDLNQSPPLDDRLSGHLEGLLLKQYKDSPPEQVLQFDKAKRVIIFDDFHRTLKALGKARIPLLQALCDFAGRVIILAHDLVSGIDEILRPGIGTLFVRYRILPFGHVGRNSLVERWIALGLSSDEDPSDPRDIIHKIDVINRILDTLVGKNFVPSYPVYILSVLQADDAGRTVDPRASTHGYFYELLIRISLTRGGRSSIQFDILTSYLSNLAYVIFLRHTTEFDEGTWKEIHLEFVSTKEVDCPFSAMRVVLLELQILQEIGGLFRFKYRYFFYYFVANFMRDNIGQIGVRSKIQAIVRKLHIEDNSNILLFLAHLSKDPFIVNELLAASREIFASKPEASLEDDVDFISDLITKDVEEKFFQVFKEDHHKEKRRQLLEAADASEQEARIAETDCVADGTSLETEDEEKDGALGGDMADFNAGLKTMQILGQIAKNFPGSLDGAVKAELVSESISVALRSLSWFFGLVSENREQLIAEIVGLLRASQAPVERMDLLREAKSAVVNIVSLLAFGLIKRASNSIGSRDLQKTYARIFSEGRTSAKALVQMSLELDHPGDAPFPVEQIRVVSLEFKKRLFAQFMLRSLVVHHFHLFPVDFRIKQRVCTTLDIKYEGSDKSDPRGRLISKKE